MVDFIIGITIFFISILIIYTIYIIFIVINFKLTLSNTIITKSFSSETGDVELKCPLNKKIHIFEAFILCLPKKYDDIDDLYLCDPMCPGKPYYNDKNVTDTCFDEITKKCNGLDKCLYSVIPSFTKPYNITPSCKECMNPIIIGKYDCIPDNYNGKLKTNRLKKCIL